LVPARNEEATLGFCLESLLNQDYPDYEVLVLDDWSTDRTADVLRRFSSTRLRKIEGKPLPQGWTGKNWACQQLAQGASGEVLLFTDADTVFAPDTLSRAVSAMTAEKLAMATGIVRNIVSGLGEQITVPFIIWSIMAILPLAVAYRWRGAKALMVASGKFLIFTRTTYEQVGGHQAVKAEAAEDLALGRVIKGAKLKWRLYDVTDLVSTRMYEGFCSAWAGFVKNFFAIFDYRLVPALFIWFWLLLITFHPLITVLVATIGHELTPGCYYSIGTIIMSISIWLLSALKNKLPKRVTIYYPLIMVVAAGIGITSIFKTLFHRTEWKGRQLPAHRIRIV
jgi:chlorobactene glucosyltransferase